VDDLLVSEADGVATVTLNRPERLNAFSDPMVFGLIDLLGDLGARADVGAIVITGAGRAFCAGGDVKAMAAAGPIDVEARIAALKRKHVLIARLRSIPKVVVAAVNGVAAGAGLALALACDFRVASRSARLGATYAKVGLPGDYGISFLLPQAAGRAIAQDLLFTGRIVEAEEALALGLVTSVVAADDLSRGVTELAGGFARGPRLAYGAIKQNLYAADQPTMQAALDREAHAVIEAMLSADHREAAAAFAEKRQPLFQGR
jgi:2-(1,2-epoxy-1,2-dihydrophenyl)acetyl-CoA isomerase